MVKEKTEFKNNIILKRYTAILICLLIILIATFAVLKVMGGDDSKLEPDISKHELYFNDVKVISSDKTVIRGHFWDNLTDTELKMIFPNLRKYRKVTGVANFQSDDSGASLYNIDAYTESSEGVKTYVQLAPQEIKHDYVFNTESKTSEVLGTSVMAGYSEIEPDVKGVKEIIFFASFKISDVFYYVQIASIESEKEKIKDEITKVIVMLIEEGRINLGLINPTTIPELRNDSLSLNEARLDVDFGSYIPKNIPNGFAFEIANRFINQEKNTLFVNWTKGMNYIDWRISNLKENDKKRITSVIDKKNYDLSLYSIPYAESVPKELRDIVDNPIFEIDELTLEVIRSRSYETRDLGDSQGIRMTFSVLYKDTLVEINSKGVSPEAIFDMLQQIKK